MGSRPVFVFGVDFMRLRDDFIPEIVLTTSVLHSKQHEPTESTTCPLRLVRCSYSITLAAAFTCGSVLHIYTVDPAFKDAHGFFIQSAFNAGSRLLTLPWTYGNDTSAGHHAIGKKMSSLAGSWLKPSVFL